MSDKDAIKQFCPSCFADNDSGSWDHVVCAGHCLNCGNGSTVQLPVWAIAEIRRSASWVGRRYYPGTEDAEIASERKALLELVTVYPGRSAERVKEPENIDRWTVIQNMPGGSSTMTWISAQTADEAMRKCCLTYVSAAQLEQHAAALSEGET